MKTFVKLFLFIACLLSIKCITSTNKNIQTKVDDEFIDELKSKANKAIVLFYVDFEKSKIEVSDISALHSRNAIDTIFQFIGDRKTNSCFLYSSNIPDGEIEFYNNDSYISSMQFVLTDTCNGFYVDVTKKTIKYKLTAFGKLILLKLKTKVLHNN